MSIQRKFRSRALAVCVASALLPFSVSADHAWSSYHWSRSANPLRLTLGDNVSSTWDLHLQISSDDWNVCPMCFKRRLVLAARAQEDVELHLGA